MLNTKTYTCGICKTTPDQLSHHKSHIETQKHKDKKELFELKLSKLNDTELEAKFNTLNINDIIQETETIIYIPIDSDKLTTKLNQYNLNKSNNTIDYMTEEMTTLKNTMIEQSNSVTNKEALKDKIHEIHNFLRNNGAGYGMNALKVFNILYGLKKIEENGLLDKVRLKKPDCEFSYLLKMANENKDEQLAELIFGNVLQSICNSELKELLFYEIPQNIKGSVFVYLLKEINKITHIEKSCNVLLSGKIYEYFIGRDESAISELGAYFTDRHIVDYILKKLDPSTNEDGTIESMIDMFGGSGGFTTGYINYLNDKYPQLINWTTEINKISHFDMNEDVIKSAGLEFFCLTGVFPNMNNLKYKNSFTDEFNGLKYKYPLTNPPYGGDKNSKSEAQSKREKVKEYIKNELPTITDEGLRIRRQKQLKSLETQEKQEKKESDKTKVSVAMCSGRIQKFAKDNGLKGNDKESCSLMLLMDILEVGGTAIGVLKEGVFFNKTYKDLRKCLVENFNVREVISVPQDQFENTSTKTSIVIFDNTADKTTEVKFSDLVVERYTEDKFAEVFGEIIIVESKDDIFGVSDTLVSQASRDEIVGNAICSLNGKDYNKKVIVVGEGYELVRLGDICDSQNGYAFKSHDYKSEGVPLITITHIKNEQLIYSNNKYIENNSKYEKFEIKKDDVIISLTGKKPTLCSIAINNYNSKQYLNQRCALLRNFKKINNYYFASIFNGFILDYINKYIGNGSNQENVSLTDILNIPIPIPKSHSKIQEWVDKISAPYNEKNAKQTQLKELETFVQTRIREIGEKEECEEVELGSVCEFKSGKFNTCNMDNKGTYPFYNATINPIGFHSEYCFDGDKYLLLIKSGNVKADGLGSVTKLYGKNACVADTVQIKSIINIDYLLYVLNLMKDKIRKTSNASVGLGHLKISEVKLIKIKLPKNKHLIQSLEATFQHIESLHHEVKVADELYKQLIQELSHEAIPQQNTLEPIINTVEETQDEEVIAITVPKKKVVKKTKLIIKNTE